MCNCNLEHKCTLSLQTLEQLISFGKTDLHTRNIKTIDIKLKNCF